MKVFFTAAIAGSPKFGGTYVKIVERLQNLGHDVTADHILKADRTEIRDQHDDDQRVRWYKKVLKMISSSDVVVAEVSTPSINVGHEISLALEKETPVVAIYKKGFHPVLLQGIRNDKFVLVEYEDIGEIIDDIHSYLEYSQEQRDTRFNFFISPKISNYLDWIAKTKRLPRAVYLRNLIQKRMEEDEEYNN